MSDDVPTRPTTPQRIDALPVYLQGRLAEGPTRLALDLWDARQAHAAEKFAEGERAATKRIAELEDTARQALDFASDMMQNLGWARQQGEDLSRELDENEADAYKLFHACWDALRMGPQRKYAKGERRAG